MNTDYMKKPFLLRLNNYIALYLISGIVLKSWGKSLVASRLVCFSVFRRIFASCQTGALMPLECWQLLPLLLSLLLLLLFLVWLASISFGIWHTIVGSWRWHLARGADADDDAAAAASIANYKECDLSLIFDTLARANPLTEAPFLSRSLCLSCEDISPIISLNVTHTETHTQTHA